LLLAVFPPVNVLVKVGGGLDVTTIVVTSRKSLTKKLDVTTIVVNADALLIFIFTPDGSMFSFPTRVFYFVNA
jgi:hypothetical protein